MGRIGILEKIYDEMRTDNRFDDFWLVTYDFPKSKGNPHFYTLFKQLLKKSRTMGAMAERIQSSIFYTNDLHAAIAATRLAKRYDADVRLFRVEEMDVHRLNRAPTIKPDYEFTIEAEEIPYVMKAVYYRLKQSSLDFQYSYETDQLCKFLRVNMHKRPPLTPIYEEILGLILNEYRRWEDEKMLLNQSVVAFGLEMDSIIPVLKSIIDYLKEHRYKGAPFEEMRTLQSILSRFLEDEEAPPDLEEISRYVHETIRHMDYET